MQSRSPLHYCLIADTLFSAVALGSTLAHAGAATSGALPRFTPVSVFTQVELDWWLAVPLLIVSGLYLWGVHRLRRRGDG